MTNSVRSSRVETEEAVASAGAHFVFRAASISLEAGGFPELIPTELNILGLVSVTCWSQPQHNLACVIK